MKKTLKIFAFIPALIVAVGMPAYAQNDDTKEVYSLEEMLNLAYEKESLSSYGRGRVVLIRRLAEEYGVVLSENPVEEYSASEKELEEEKIHMYETFLCRDLDPGVRDVFEHLLFAAEVHLSMADHFSEKDSWCWGRQRGAAG